MSSHSKADTGEVTIGPSGGLTYTAHQIVFTKLTECAQLPLYMTSQAAGADLFSAENVQLFSQTFRLVGTGLSAVIPPGFEVQIRPRSGLAAKHGITVLNAPGTIDADYTLEWKVILINHGPTNFPIRIGDAIAQMIVAPVTQLPFTENFAGELIPQRSVSSAQRSGGFGSTSPARK